LSGDPRAEGPAKEGRQREDPVMVVVPHGDHYRAGRLQRRDHLVEVVVEAGRVEVRPHRVVHAHQHDRDVRPRPQGLGQLSLSHAADPRATDRVVRQADGAEGVREQRCEAAPPAVLRGIADPDPDRVAEHRDRPDLAGVYQHGCRIRVGCARTVCSR
jgi:hypothetical protein